MTFFAGIGIVATVAFGIAVILGIAWVVIDYRQLHEFTEHLNDKCNRNRDGIEALWRKVRK